ncbi:MAG: NADH-quinone oxidoreductase subunit NuoG [Actinomycetota bacterium]
MTATENNPTEAITGVPFTLNGKAVEAKEGELLIDACDRNGAHIPRFCYHPRMEPVGMCRMCLVEVDTGRGMALQPSCMLPVTPEMKVETESEVTKDAQDGVLELLLVNHPLDCPVCDKGGECPLQDNAYSYGPGESRFVEEKRHYEKPIPISDLVHLDRERCILCDRCTRFASEVAGDPLIHFIDRGSQTQVNTFPDDPFSSYFSGNTVQICPVGALTAAPYRFKARPWDLDAVESTATVDTTGARVVVQASRNEVIRVLGVDSDAVNWGWLSDKDRFSYEVAGSADRITRPQVRADGELGYTRWGDALAASARALSGDPVRIAAIGGARFNLEDQYAWAKLLKGVINTDHVDCQMGDGLPAPMALGLPTATIDQTCEPGGVVVLCAADPKEELPSLYLRLRHALVNDGVDLIEIGPRATSLSSRAAVRLPALPGTVGQVMAAVADDTGLDGLDGDDVAAARELLSSGRPVTVILGRANQAESARYTADAVGALMRLLPDVRFLPALRRGNVFGGLEMGLTPGFLPGGVRRSSTEPEAWPNVADFDGRDTEGILRSAVNGDIDTLILLGADPVADFPDRRLAAAALDQVETVIAVDAFHTASTVKADVLLPAALFGEADGTFVNLEGRMSPVRAKVTAPDQARADWMIAAELAAALGFDLGFATIDELQKELQSMSPSLAEIDWADVEGGSDGPLLNRKRQWVLEFGDAAPSPVPDGYGLRLVVDRKLWDGGTMVQESPSLAGLAEPTVAFVSAADAERFNVDTDPGEDARITVAAGEQSIVVPYTVDAGQLEGTVRVTLGRSDAHAHHLVTAGQAVVHVTIAQAEAG